MDHSEQLNELAAALAAAQAELKPAEKDRTNTHFRNRYATLESIWEAARAVLPMHGLSVVQTFEPAETGTLALTTTLLHKSGQWLSGTAWFPLGAKVDPQGYASASTYARRYGLQAIVGIVADEDDDGNAASRAQQTGGEQRHFGPPTGLPKIEDLDLTEMGKRELWQIAASEWARDNGDPNDRLNTARAWNTLLNRPPDGTDISAFTPEDLREVIKSLRERRNPRGTRPHEIGA